MREIHEGGATSRAAGRRGGEWARMRPLDALPLVASSVADGSRRVLRWSALLLVATDAGG